jgi:hypothetical protein
LVDSKIEMRADFTMSALDALRRFDGDKASRFHNRLALDNILLVGHSRGGDAVVRAAEMNAKRAAAARFGIKALCLLAPTDFTGTLVPSQVRSVDATITPFLAVILGALDGDVAGWGGANNVVGTGFRHYDRATCDKAQLFLDHCNHNRFNAVWTKDDFGMMPDDVKSGGRLLKRADQEKLAIELIGGLARWKLLGKAGESGYFDGSKTNAVGADLSIQHAFGGDVVPIDLMENLLASELGTRSFNNATIDRFPDIAFGPRALDAETNHTTGVLAVDKNLPGSPPAALEITLDPADQDWSSFDALNLSVGGIFDLTSEATISAGPLPKFILEIRDKAGGASLFESTDLVTKAALRRPVFHEAQHTDFPLATSSKADPTVITTAKIKGKAVPHRLTTGDEILITGHTGSTPSINGRHKVTVLTPTTFSIPVKVTVAGSGGRFRRIENCTVLRLETLTVNLVQVRFDPAGANLTQVDAVAIHPPVAFPNEILFDALQLVRI